MNYIKLDKFHIVFQDCLLKFLWRPKIIMLFMLFGIFLRSAIPFTLSFSFLICLSMWSVHMYILQHVNQSTQSLHPLVRLRFHFGNRHRTTNISRSAEYLLVILGKICWVQTKPWISKMSQCRYLCKFTLIWMRS